jgi:CheY-like chemotaxis protein
MPRMDGYQVARELRRHSAGRSIKLVAVTGWGQAQDKQRALQSGFDDHVTKPVEPQVLLGLLV